MCVCLCDTIITLHNRDMLADNVIHTWFDHLYNSCSAGLKSSSTRHIDWICHVVTPVSGKITSVWGLVSCKECRWIAKLVVVGGLNRVSFEVAIGCS